jgi:hypothetical protein
MPWERRLMRLSRMLLKKLDIEGLPAVSAFRI